MKFEVFGAMHLILMLILPVSFVILFFCLRKKDEKTQNRVLFWVSIANIAIMAVQKVLDVAIYGLDWTESVPLHLCNVLTIIMPFVFRFKKPLLQAIAFFVAVPSCVAPFITGYAGYVGYGFENVCIPIFFVVHSLNIVFGLLVVCLGLYKPNVKDALWCSLFAFLYLVFCHVVNVVLRAAKLSLHSNFLFTFGGDGNVALDFLYNLIPIPFVYVLPLCPIIVGVLALEGFLFQYFSKKKN